MKRFRDWTDADRFRAVLILNVLVVGGELYGGFASDSVSLTTDALHALLHVAVSWIALRGETQAERFPTFRARELAARLNARFFTPLAILVVFGSIARLFAPAQIETALMQRIAVLGLAVNVFAAWILHAARQESATINRRTFYLHMVYDALGSTLVILASIMIGRTGWNWIDPLFSIGLAILLVRAGKRILRELEHERH